MAFAEPCSKDHFPRLEVFMETPSLYYPTVSSQDWTEKCLLNNDFIQLSIGKTPSFDKAYSSL